MSELALIEDTAAALFGAPAHDAAFEEDAWNRIAASGLTLVGIPEELGGSGGTLAEAAVVARAAARAAAMLPVAETLLGAWLLASAKLELPEGPITGCVLDAGELVAIDKGYRLTGSAAAVPWARFSSTVAVLAQGAVVAVDPAVASIVRSENLAGEPRDDLVFDDVLIDGANVGRSTLIRGDVVRRGALLRAIGIAGALEAASSLTFDLVRQREQFGRPLAAFQAVQQLVAELAAEVAATAAAVDAAVARDDLVRVATAKVQADRGATVGARAAHQLHGAIGMTQECDLHLFTRRMWAWRDEYGSETFWANELGREAARAPNLWSFIADEDAA